MKFKYSFRVDEEEGRKKSSEIILAIPSLLLFPFFRLHDRRQSYSLGEFREEGEGGGGHTRASQRPRSSHARSTLINHDGPARKERKKKKIRGDHLAARSLAEAKWLPFSWNETWNRSPRDAIEDERISGVIFRPSSRTSF